MVEFNTIPDDYFDVQSSYQSSSSPVYLGIYFRIFVLMFMNCYHILNKNVHLYHDLSSMQDGLPLKSFVSKASTMSFIYSGIQVAHYVNSKFSLLLKLFWFAALSFCSAFLFFIYYERGITYEQIINNLLICKTYMKLNLYLGPLNIIIFQNCWVIILISIHYKEKLWWWWWWWGW